jgi:hypothetical protein
LSFLKQLGQILVTATSVVTGIGIPYAKTTATDKDDAFLAVAKDKLDEAFGAIVGAEMFGQALNLPGPDKAKAAAPALFQILLGSKLIAGKKPKDPAKAKAAAEAMGGSLADFLNAFED